MSYLIELSRTADKQLLRLGHSTHQSISDVVRELGQEPRPHGAKKIIGTELWRVRVGKYRIVYQIDESKKVISIARVGKRDEQTYKRL